MRGRDHGEERRLAGVRLANQPDVGDELELELQRPRLSVFAWLVLPRRLMRRRREVGVPLPASAPFGDDDSVAMLEDFAEQFRSFEISNDRPDGNRHDDIIAGTATLVRP